MALSSFPSSRSAKDDQTKDKAALRRLESDLIILESDKSKLDREIAALELELRDIKTKWTRMGMEMQTKEATLKKKQQSLGFAMEEIRQLKKKINVL